jgi:quinol monooxygenase YgiN
MLSRLALWVVLGCVVLAPAARAGDDPPHPIIATVKKAVKDTSKPFTLVVGLKVKEGQEGKLEAAFKPARKATLKEEGCLRYELNRGHEGKATRYLIYERWKNLAGLEVHVKCAHFRKLLEELKDSLDGTPTVTVLVPAGE